MDFPPPPTVWTPPKPAIIRAAPDALAGLPRDVRRAVEAEQRRGLVPGAPPFVRKPTCSYHGIVYTAGSTSSPNVNFVFNGVNAVATDTLVVVMHYEGDRGATFAGMSVNGSAAAQRVAAVPNVSLGIAATAIYSITGIAAANITVLPNISGVSVSTRGCVNLYKLTNLRSQTPAVASNIALDEDSTMALAINVPAYGVLIVGGTVCSGAAAFTTTGFNENYDTNHANGSAGSTRYMGGQLIAASSALPGHAVTASGYNASEGDGSLVAAAFR